MLGIVVSRADEASVHIGDRLRDAVEWTSHEDPQRPAAEGGGTYYRTAGAELREFDALHIELERPAEPFDDPDVIAFASRHSGDSGPLLTAHCTGNFGPAEVGGNPGELALAAPGALAAVLATFDERAPDGYDTGLECTHHGPTDVEVPSLFVEIGSDETEWRDPAAASAVATAILSLRGVQPLVERTFVGFGGGHYAPRFTRIVRETDWAVGHIAADWGLEAMAELDPAVIAQVFEQSGARLAVVDGDRPDIVEVIEDLGFRVVGETWLRETSSVPLRLIERAESALTTVDDGLRFGRQARSGGGLPKFGIVEPAADLLADVNGIDPERVRQAVAAEAVAYETVESGHRVVGRVAVPDRTAWEPIEAAFVDLLRERFDDVAIEEDEIVVVEHAFDPERAQALGVDPGPQFGELASGRSVTIDGETVDPDEVHVVRERRYNR